MRCVVVNKLNMYNKLFPVVEGKVTHLTAELHPLNGVQHHVFLNSLLYCMALLFLT
jgi:hypothetical protein